jgi:hypothetical protein
MCSESRSTSSLTAPSLHARGSTLVSLFAALFCCGGAIAPAQAATIPGDTLFAFGTSVTLPESAEPGIISLPIAAAADHNAAFGLLEWTGSNFVYSDWIYFNDAGDTIYMASDLYPNGPPPNTYVIGTGYEPLDGSPFDVGFWGLGIGRGFILAQSSEDASGAGVPESATWAMMLIGFGGLGASMRSRRAGAYVGDAR